MNNEEQDRFWAAFDADRFAECLERARILHYDTADPFYEYLYGEVLRRLGRYAEAEPILWRTYSESNAYRGVQELSLGQLLQSTGRLNEAIAFFQRAVHSLPENPDGWNRLSLTLANLGRIDDAIAVLKEGLARAETHRDELYLNMGRLFRNLDDYGAAVGFFEKALELTPGYHEAADAREDVLAAISVRKHRSR